VKKLPDNGDRLKSFSAKIDEELSKRRAVDGVANILSNLSIKSLSIDRLEWSGNIQQTQVKIKDSQSDGVVNKNLFYDSVSSLELDGHASYLCSKEHFNNTADRSKFLPHKTTKSNVHDPEKEKIRKQNKYWENTAATPPLIQHCSAKLLTLSESIEIEKNQRSKLLQIANEQASERLVAKQSRTTKYNEMVQAENFVDFRCAEQISEASTDSDDADDDDNDNDDDDINEKGGIIFPVYN
jgi:hypothetical protein